MTKPSSKHALDGHSTIVLTTERAVPIFAAALLGIFIIGGVGFSHIAAVHNAAHDYRHSMAFPCH